MTVIGITGPTGAGKTTVLNVLKELDGAVVDCDELYHELLRTDAGLQNELKARFGGDIFDENGDLRRKELGVIVFKDEKALSDLNAITHRYIIAGLDRLIARAEAQGCPAIALDAVALIESGAAELCRVTVAVTAPEEARLRRIMDREGIPEEYARSRIAAQKPSRWFEERCDHILRSDGSREELEARARTLFMSIISKEEF